MGEELKEQIQYITGQVTACKKETHPKKNDRELGEWTAYETCLNIIKNSKSKTRRDNDFKLLHH